MSSLYAFINLGTILVPFLFSFHKKYPFYKEWRYYFPANIIVAIIFIAWDIYFTKIGVWGFNPKYLLGIDIFNLPIEEVAFFICIPFSCTFTYFALRAYIKKQLTFNVQRSIFAIVMLFSAIVAFSHISHYYTFSSFLLAAICCIPFVLKPIGWSLHFLLCFLIIAFPFTIVNGLLTGSFIPEEVVWYNDGHNLNLRFLTIPVADFSYSFALQILNVYFYEKFKK